VLKYAWIKFFFSPPHLINARIVSNIEQTAVFSFGRQFHFIWIENYIRLPTAPPQFLLCDISPNLCSHLDFSLPLECLYFSKFKTFCILSLLTKLKNCINLPKYKKSIMIHTIINVTSIFIVNDRINDNAFQICAMVDWYYK
jgi:hypothetical protein